MPQNSIHPDNDTPTASDEGIKRMDKDTPYHPVPGAPMPSPAQESADA